MKELTLSDGTKLGFTDSSTIFDLVQVVPDFADIDPVRAKMTEANLDGAELKYADAQSGDIYTNIKPEGVWVEAEMTGNITVHFQNREKTAQEIWQEEQDAAINFLMGM